MYLTKNTGIAKTSILLQEAKFQSAELIKSEPCCPLILNASVVVLQSTVLTLQHDLIFSWSTVAFIHCHIAKEKLMTVTTSICNSTNLAS